MDTREIVYGIYADKYGRCGVSHFVSYFTKREDAEKYVKSCNGKSIDPDTGTHWYYEVREVIKKDLSWSKLSELNEISKYFPY